MIDIYPVPKNPRKKKGSTAKSGLFFKYGVGFITLLAVLYLGLGFANQYIDKWLELEPIEVDTKSQAVDEKPEKNDEEKVIDESKIAEEEKADDETDKVLSSDTSLPDTDSSDDQATEDKSEDIDKQAISLRVLNGNALYGAASRAEKILEDNGFKVSAIGNANNQTYASTVVYYKSDKSAEAELVSKTLSDNNYTTSINQDDSLVGTNDVLVVIGKE